MKIEKLEWDTNFFEMKIGKVDIKESDKFNPTLFRTQAYDENYELVYVFNYDYLLKPVVTSIADLKLADIMLTMRKKFDKESQLRCQYDFRTTLTEKELLDVYKIAGSISEVSRFYKEPKIGPEKTRKLYHTWVDNSINSSIADGMIVVKVNETISGINLIKTDKINKIGHCSVIGVNPDAKGKGIGKKLWDQAFSYWAKEQTIDFCQVPFSLQNKESFNFHLKMGFNKIIETKYIYHFSKEST